MQYFHGQETDSSVQYHALSLDFMKFYLHSPLIFTMCVYSQGPNSSHFCITNIIHSGRVEVRDGKLCFHLSYQ